MLTAAVAAASEIFSPPFRSVMWKSLSLTLALLLLFWLGLDRLTLYWIGSADTWLSTILSFLVGAGLFVGMAFLIAPISSVVAGFFLDDLAERVEAAIGVAGRPVPIMDSLWIGAKFAGLSLLVNAAALLLLLVPGVNVIAFFAANAFLLGRAYFELAALRFRPIEEVRALQHRHRFYLFLCGGVIALFVAIPVLNLVTPLFGTAFMVRIHRRIAPLPLPIKGYDAQASFERSN
jgi:CysZ protein